MTWIDKATKIKTNEDKIIEVEEAARNKFKSERVTAVSEIVVKTSAGNAFDGDEVSQGRMARAIVALNETGRDNIQWVLADNTIITATKAELSEALGLSADVQTALWVA